MATPRIRKSTGIATMPWAGILAMAMLCAALATASQMAGWSWRDPILFAGEANQPMHREFNILGFVVPGLLMAVQAVRARISMGHAAGRGERMAMGLWIIAALAFAGLGLFPLDLTRSIDEGRNTWTAAAWYLWWVSAVLGCVAAILGREPRLRLYAIIAVVEILLGVWYLPGVMPVGFAQLFTVMAWMSWPFWRAPPHPDRAEGITAL